MLIIPRAFCQTMNHTLKNGSKGENEHDINVIKVANMPDIERCSLSIKLVIVSSIWTGFRMK